MLIEYLGCWLTFPQLLVLQILKKILHSISLCTLNMMCPILT
nr:MAG TPA: hypothetical protein [Caudoviricetes sp.]